jgi:hypothetical protein
MEFYLRWLAKHEQQPHEESPLGLILCSEKSQERIELMELGKSSIRVAEYLTVLPPRDLLTMYNSGARLSEMTCMRRDR